MSTPLLTLNDGRRIPQLGFGVWQVSSGQTVPVVSAALEAGYRHIDTASAYGNERGVGQAVAASGLDRDDLFVTTKLGNNRHRDARAALEESLERLQLDYVDLYLIHWPVPGVDKRLDAWREMEQARGDGLVRSIGVSNFTPKYLDEILRGGSVAPAVNQIEYHPTFQQRDLEQTNTEHGILTESYSPLGLGEDLRNSVIAGIAARVGKTPAQVILRWHLQQGRVAIPKSSTVERIRENFAVTGFELTDADLAAIDAVHSGNLLGWDPETVRS